MSLTITPLFSLSFMQPELEQPKSLSSFARSYKALFRVS
jgi:hypothetical protein